MTEVLVINRCKDQFDCKTRLTDVSNNPQPDHVPSNMHVHSLRDEGPVAFVDLDSFAESVFSERDAPLECHL